MAIFDVQWFLTSSRDVCCFFKQKRSSHLFMTMITEKKLLGFWLFSLVVKYLFWVQVAPVRFREEPNIFPFLFFPFFFQKTERETFKQKQSQKQWIHQWWERDGTCAGECYFVKNEVHPAKLTWQFHYRSLGTCHRSKWRNSRLLRRHKSSLKPFVLLLLEQCL